jgi:transposase-like protein
MMSETAIATKSRRNRSVWEELMAQYEASGLKQRTFCEQHGLAYSTFCYWRKQLRQSSTIENPSEHLFELPTLPGDEYPDWRVELDLGHGVTLRMK